MWFPEPGTASVALLHVYSDRRLPILLRRVPLDPLVHILQPVKITNRDFLEHFVTRLPNKIQCLATSLSTTQTTLLQF